ncbi:MAG: hypothetical protein KGI54_09035 [Pseudomonadota bacterium]|nr:hypothetical protein [Pseudomonadota bacterium]
MDEVAQNPLAPSQEEEISLLDLLIVLAKHKKLIFWVTFSAAVISIIVSLLLPNIYTASTTILPPQENESSASAMLGQLGALAGGASSMLGIKNPSDLYVGMLKSRTVAQTLVDQFNLKTLYRDKTDEAARKDLKKNTDIKADKDGFITVAFSDRNPQRAANIANAYVDALRNVSQRLAVTDAARRRLFFQNQMALANKKLADAEYALEQTQEKTGLIELSSQEKAAIESNANLRAEIAAKEVQLSAMRMSTTESNPDYVRLEQELVELKSQLSKLQNGQDLGEGDILVPTGKVPQVGLEYLRKVRDVKYYESITEILAKQFEIAKIDEARDGPLIQILDKAIPPEKKSKPKRALIVLLSTFAAFFLSILVVFLKESIEQIKLERLKAARLNLLINYLWRKKV